MGRRWSGGTTLLSCTMTKFWAVHTMVTVINNSALCASDLLLEEMVSVLTVHRRTHKRQLWEVLCSLAYCGNHLTMCMYIKSCNIWFTKTTMYNLNHHFQLVCHRLFKTYINWLVRAPTSFPLDCQIKKMTTANTIVAVQCEWTKIILNMYFLSGWQKIHLFKRFYLFSFRQRGR